MAKKVLKGVGKVAGAIGVGSVVKSLIGGKKKKDAPVEAPEPVMPIADDEAVREARRRSIAAQMGRGGRQSTILSDDSTKLGGY